VSGRKDAQTHRNKFDNGLTQVSPKVTAGEEGSSNVMRIAYIQGRRIYLQRPQK